MAHHSVNPFSFIPEGGLFSPACPNPAAEAAVPSDCAFYTDCLESTFMCGPDGYPLGYGDKYCERFLDNKHYFTEEGQAWIDGTLVCLKEALVETVEEPDGIDCEQVKKTAFASHVDCYINNGFCELAFKYSSPFETSRFYRDLMRVYDVTDFASLIAIK